MYSRILRMQTKPELIDKAARIFESSVVPKCHNQQGFISAYFMADRKTGYCMPVTFWNTEKDMLANEKNRFFQEQVSKFIVFFQAPPVRETYEIIYPVMEKE
ncbi:hypothetical protein ACFLT9_03195 [Acidobacteriota bacterium]